MCVIPFDRERPFPLRGRTMETRDSACAAFGAELARYLDQNATLSQRLNRAEARVDDLMASLMRADLAGHGETRLPRAG